MVIAVKRDFIWIDEDTEQSIIIDIKVFPDRLRFLQWAEDHPGWELLNSE